MIFIRHPFNSNIKFLDFGDCSVTADEVRDTIGKYFGCEEFTLLYNGKKLYNAGIIPNNSTVHVALSLPGGKGGFGSMLRAIGAQIEKTTNREACRDLSGRRLRDINEEQRLKKWIAKKAEREAEKIKRRKERLERLKTKPSHKFFDFEYERKISELPERINDALSEGLQKAKQPLKRPHESAGPSKPKKAWLSDEFPGTSSDSDSDEMSSSNNSSCAKKRKTELVESSGCSSDVSDISQSHPGSSKMDLNFESEESSTSKSDCESTKMKTFNEQERENSSTSEKRDIGLHKDEENSSNDQLEVLEEVNQKESKQEWTDKVSQLNIDRKEASESASPVKLVNTVVETKEPEEYSSINLLDFQDISEIEALGLDRLKTELMSRNLKCGGSLSDRAQRLWKIRGLQPNEYPSNLLAKTKK